MGALACRCVRKRMNPSCRSSDFRDNAPGRLPPAWPPAVAKHGFAHKIGRGGLCGDLIVQVTAEQLDLFSERTAGPIIPKERSPTPGGTMTNVAICQ